MFNKCQYCSYCYGTNVQEVTIAQIFVQIGNKYIWQVTILQQIWQQQLLWKKQNSFVDPTKGISPSNPTRIQFRVKITKCHLVLDQLVDHVITVDFTWIFFFFFSIYIMQRHNISWLQCSLNDRHLQGASIVQKYWFSHSLQI